MHDYRFPELTITYKWVASTNEQLIVVEKDDLYPKTFKGLSIELSKYLTELQFSDGSNEVSLFNDGIIYIVNDSDPKNLIWNINLGWDNILKFTAITPKIAQKISVRLKKIKEYMEFVTSNQVFTTYI